MEIWEAYPQHRNTRMPSIINNIEPDSIVYCGINPSFSTRGFNTMFKETRFHNIDPTTFYDYDNRASYSLDDSLEIDELAIERHPYFTKMKDIGTQTGYCIQPTDLFHIRETDQKKVKKMIFKPKTEELNDFGKKQFELTLETILSSNPKCILVANALASNIVLSELNLKFNNKIGTYTFKNIPVFLSSMLTGQRALDNHTYKRLVWQIKNTI